MKTRVYWITAAALLLALPLAGGGTRAAEITFDLAKSPLDAALHERAVRVMHAYYNFEFDTALAEADAIRRELPDNPVGHFLISEAHWWQAVYNQDEPGHVEAFQAAADRVVELCEERLGDDERDPIALFFLGGAYGRKAIIAGIESQQLAAVKASLAGRKYIKQLNKYHREAEDAYFGLGLYNYYAAELSWFARIVAKLLFGLSGNQARGIEELERAAGDGLFTQVEARIFLSIIYLDQEGRYDEAIGLLRQLNEQYPDNLSFYGLLAYAYRTNQDYANAIAMLETLVDKAAATPVFGRRSRSLSTYFLGSTYKVAGRLHQSIATLTQAVEAEADGANNWLLTNALLERGRVHDLLGERDQALRDYERVVQLRDFRGSQKKATALLEAPYEAPETETQHYLEPQVNQAADSR